MKGIESNTIPIATLERDILGARIVPIRSAWIAKRVLGFYAARVWAGGVLRVGTTRAPRKFFKQTGQFGV